MEVSQNSKSDKKMSSNRKYIKDNKQQNFPNNSKIERAGIFVKNFPDKSHNDVVKYFSEFGSVTWSHIGHDFLLLTFTDPTTVEKILAKTKHLFQGQRLFVKRKWNRIPTVPVNDEEIDGKVYANILSQLEIRNNFDDGFNCLLYNLRPPSNDNYAKYNMVCEDMHSVLYNAFRLVKIHPFGSTVTGLGFNNSDVDVFLSGVKGSEDEIKYLYNIKRILSMSKLFANCFVVRTAKIPIVKCLHLKTNLKCDINIKNMLGVLNSRLINYYLDNNVKVRRAMLVIKYWAKCHNITGQHNLFTNYSLVMMFIFFLQQPPYEFPSVYSLQSVEHIDDKTTSPWNGHIQTNNFSSKALMLTPLEDIICQFFQFYINFNFNTNIVCPYLGEALPVKYFESPENISERYIIYKKLLTAEDNNQMAFKINCPVCIQDPFEHSRNLTPIVTDSVLNNFKAYAELAVKIFSNGQQILYKLYKDKPLQIKKLTYDLANDSLRMTLLKSNNLRYLSIDQTGNVQSLNERWFSCFRNFVVTALEDLLQFQVTQLLEDETKTKSIKYDSQNDIHDTRETTFICTVKCNFWDSRKSIAKILKLTSANSKLMERERTITERLKTMHGDVQRSSADNMSFKMAIIDKNGGADIVIEKVSAYKKSFRPFSLFFKTNIPLWFNLYERDMNQAVVETDP